MADEEVDSTSPRDDPPDDDTPRDNDDDEEDHGDGRRGGSSRRRSRSRSRDQDQKGDGGDSRRGERARSPERRDECRRPAGGGYNGPMKKLCFAFEQRGRCTNGIDCGYAHGQQEIGMMAGSRRSGGKGGKGGMGMGGKGKGGGRFGDDGYRGKGGGRGRATEQLLRDFGGRREREPSPYDPDDASAGSRSKGDSGLERALGGGPTGPRTKLLVSAIPDEFYKFDVLHGFFKKFGDIEGLELKSKNGEATVTFASEAEAEAAIKCPDAILGSRFITTSWYKPPRPTRDWGGGGKGKGRSGGPRITQLCQQFQWSRCSRGMECRFAHTGNELGEPQDEAFRMRQEAGEAVVMAGNGRDPNWDGKGKGRGKEDEAPDYRLLRQTCWEYMEQGTCTRETSCTYAHGTAEIGVPCATAIEGRVASGTLAMPKGKGKGGKGGKGGWADGGKGKSKGKGKDKGQVVDAEGAAAAEGGPALSAGAKRGPPQLGGGSWKKPKVEAIPDGPEGKAILEKKLGEQQGMMAKLEAMKESAAKQKIMLQLKGKMAKTTEALAAFEVVTGGDDGGDGGEEWAEDDLAAVADA